MPIPQTLIDELYCSIEKSQTNIRSGAIKSATREDVIWLAQCLMEFKMFRFLAVSESKDLTELPQHQRSVAVFESALAEETEAMWKKRVNDLEVGQSKEIREAEQRITKYRTETITRWTKAEPIATRVIEASRIAKYDASDCIAQACDFARLLAMNLFAPQEQLCPFNNAIAALKRFAPIVVARTIPAVIRQQTIVLSEGADNTPYNIRISLTCSAYLEANGDVGKAIAALKREGHKVSQSTFYKHLGVKDKQEKGWRNGIISEQVGNLENGVSPRYNGKQSVPKG